MKVWSAQLLGLCLLGLMFSFSASAGEAQDVDKEKAEPVKESATEAVDEDASKKHDVLKTKFLGSRPYMESKTR